MVCLTIAGPPSMSVLHFRISNQYSKSENVENGLLRTGIISKAKRNHFMLVMLCLL